MQCSKVLLRIEFHVSHQILYTTMKNDPRSLPYFLCTKTQKSADKKWTHSSKSIFQKISIIKVSLLLFLKEKKWTNSADFLPRKMTLKTPNWHFSSADFRVLVKF